MLKSLLITKLNNRTILAATVILFIFFLLIRLIDFNFFGNIKRSSFDYYQSFFPISYEESPVSIVAIDEKSLERYGQFPWPRTLLADLINKIGKAGPIVIGVDILLPEEDRTSLKKIAEQYQLDEEVFKDFYYKLSNDQLLSNEFRQNNVVLGISPSYHRIQKEKPLKQRKRYVIEKGKNVSSKNFYYYPESIRSLSILEQNAKGIGNVGYVPERDGIVRKVPMMIKIGNKLWPSMELEMIRSALGQKKYYISKKFMSGQRITLGEYSIPTDEQSQKWIYYKDPLPQQFISAADILDDTFDSLSIQNKIVYIGATAVGLSDIVATPRTAASAGVEVRANVMENILSNQHITKPSWTYTFEIILLFLITLIIFYTSLKKNIVLSISIFATSQIVFPAVSFVIFRMYLIVIDYTFNFLMAFITLGSSYLINYLHKNLIAKEEQEKRQKILKEMKFAQEIQAHLIPKEHKQPEVIYGINIPAKQVSGDYFDYLTLDDGRIIFTLADVSGKGAASGLVMSRASSLFRLFAKQGLKLSDIVLNINREICDRSAKGMFITMVVGEFNPSTKEVSLINAGHESVLCIDHDMKSSLYKSNFRPIGIVDMKNENAIEPIKINSNGGKIFIYTDGVTEGYINTNKQELGASGVEQIIKTNYQSSLKEIIDKIVRALTNTEQDRRDDITCLGINTKS